MRQDLDDCESNAVAASSVIDSGTIAFPIEQVAVIPDLALAGEGPICSANFAPSLKIRPSRPIDAPSAAHRE